MRFLFDPGSGHPLTSVGLLVLRVGIGGSMATHGWGKLQMVLEAQAAQFGDPIGIGAWPSLVLTAFAELVCAVLVMVGLLTRPAALFPVFVMAVAAFVVHGNDPWTMDEGARRFFAGESQFWFSRQPALIYLIVFLSLILTGAGRYSIDARIRRGKNPS